MKLNVNKAANMKTDNRKIVSIPGAAGCHRIKYSPTNPRYAARGLCTRQDGITTGISAARVFLVFFFFELKLR